jgi:predicted metalloprotease
VQHQRHTKGTANGEALNGDCLAGSWAASVQSGARATNGQGLSLSPGDLDEAIRAFIVFGGGTREPGAKTTNSPFARLTAFRKGFEQGPTACS